MLEKVGFKNFLALRDVEIDLEPFTVLVGPNSSGKSTILEGIFRLSRVRFGNASNIVSYFRAKAKTYEEFLSIVHRNSSEKKIVFSFIDDPEYKNVYEIGWNTGSEKIDFDSYAVPIIMPDGDSFFPIPEKNPDPEFMGKMLRFSYDLTVKPSYTENTKPYLEPTGQGLATVCAYLQNLDYESFENIQENLRKIIPSFTRFKIMPIAVNASDWFNVFNLPNHHKYLAENRYATGQELIFDFEKAKNIKAIHVSEGTIFALTVLVITALSSEETVVLIDDLERGLHPKAVRDLMSALRHLQSINPNLQIIATSHSPYILDRLEAKEVRVVNLDPELGTLVAKLEDYPDFDKWREAMTPGEFWSFVGESWVKDLFTERVRG